MTEWLDRRIPRRALLASAAGGTAALVGCSVNTGAASRATSAQNAKKVVFPDYPSTKLPTGNAMLQWVDTGARKSDFIKAVLDAFTAKHPNIKTDYNGGGFEIVDKVVPLGIRNHNAPDVFSQPQGVPTATMINEGWVRPLDDIVPDFAKWKAAFPDTAFIPGIHTFNGKTYTYPLTGLNLVEMTIYDSKNMAAAGYDDPANQIKTWDDFYNALKKVVKTGVGGLMTAGPQLSQLIHDFATSAGWLSVNGIDPATGQYVYDAPQVLQAYEFLQKLVTDKLLVPGFLTRQTDEGAAEMPAGKSAVLIAGPVYSNGWQTNNAQWQYAQGIVPSPNGDAYHVPQEQTGDNNLWVYAGTKVPSVVGELVAYMGSEEGQKLMVILTQGSLVSELPKANSAAKRTGIMDKHSVRAAAISDQIIRSAPIVAERNPDSAKVDLVIKQVEPVWADLWVGIFSGQIKNVRSELRSYNAKNEQALDTAIATAAKQGASITRDDYKFPNWDPSKDYTLADYKSLPDFRG